MAAAILGCIGKKISKKDLAKIQNNETGGFDMCKALQDMINDGILEGTIRTLFDLFNKNLISLTDAAEQASVSEERFMELVEQFQLNTNKTNHKFKVLPNFSNSPYKKFCQYTISNKFPEPWLPLPWTNSRPNRICHIYHL